MKTVFFQAEVPDDFPDCKKCRNCDLDVNNEWCAEPGLVEIHTAAGEWQKGEPPKDDDRQFLAKIKGHDGFRVLHFAGLSDAIDDDDYMKWNDGEWYYSADEIEKWAEINKEAGK